MFIEDLLQEPSNVNTKDKTLAFSNDVTIWCHNKDIKQSENQVSLDLKIVVE